MAVFIKMVIYAVNICRYYRYKIRPVLPVIRLAHLHPCYLRYCKRFVCGFQKTGQEIFLSHGLRTHLWIYTRAFRKKEFFNSVSIGKVNDISLDHKVFIYKLSRVCSVGMDTTYLCSSKKDIFGFLLCEKSFYLFLSC